MKKFIAVLLMMLPVLSFAETAEKDYEQFFRPGTNSTGKSVAKEMKAADVSKEFECPIFSNSPYADILKSINSLESAIKLFPTCAADGNLKSAVDLGKDLKGKITLIKQSIESGKGLFNQETLDEVLNHSAQFQDMLVNLAQSSETCYRSEDGKNKEFIFRVNDALQSISPMALDFVTKIPGLNSAALPAVAGSAALVQGISTLEKVMHESATLDVRSEEKGLENRIALIKNTCQFMKVYNKVEILQMNREDRFKKIEDDYRGKVKPHQEKSESLMEVISQTQAGQSPEAKQVAKIKVTNRSLKIAIETAKDEFNGSTSDLGKCTAARTLAKMVKDNSLLTNFEKLAKLTKKVETSTFKVNKFNEMYTRIQLNTKDLKQCSDEAMDWIKVVIELLTESNKLISQYEIEDSRSENFIEAADQLKAAAIKTQDEQENKKKIEKFTEISVFEPSEISKKMFTMPKYLFNGPDGGLLSFMKTGPVYDFLKYNDELVARRYEIFWKNMTQLFAFEQEQMSEPRPHMSRFGDNKKAFEYFAKFNKAKSQLSSITPEYIVMGSYQQRKICDNLKMVEKTNEEMKSLIASSYYMCKMIDPVLKEDGVSSRLLSYCRRKEDGYRKQINSLILAEVPKIVEIVLERKKDLACEDGK